MISMECPELFNEPSCEYLEVVQYLKANGWDDADDVLALSSQPFQVFDYAFQVMLIDDPEGMARVIARHGNINTSRVMYDDGFRITLNPFYANSIVDRLFFT